MKFLPLLVTIILFSCGSEPTPPQLKNAKPGKLEFFETYTFSEIQPSWQAACDWISANDSLAENSGDLASLVLANTHVMIGYVKEENISKVNELLAIPEVKKNFPENLRFMWSYNAEETPNGSKMYVLYAIRRQEGSNAIIDGRSIVSTQAIESYNGSPAISITMNSQGTKDWEQMTTKNIGRAIAIAFNDQVLTCPVVNGTISGGSTEISGNFTKAQAEELAARIYAGRK